MVNYSPLISFAGSGTSGFGQFVPPPKREFYCRKPNGVLTRVSWKYFLADCDIRKNRLCSPLSGGWVAAVTVCGQQLF